MHTARKALPILDLAVHTSPQKSMQQVCTGMPNRPIFRQKPTQNAKSLRCVHTTSPPVHTNVHTFLLKVCTQNKYVYPVRFIQQNVAFLTHRIACTPPTLERAFSYPRPINTPAMRI